MSMTVRRVTAVLWLVAVLVFDPPGRLSATVRVDVSEDGHATVESTAATSPGRLVVGADVPLPASPDWQGDLERQVGGLAFGDVDGDGDLDLASGCYHSNSFPPIDEFETLVYLNQGGMLETTPSWVSVDQRHTTDVRFADVDGDGRQDLLCANGGEGLDASVIYLNGAGGIDTIPDWFSVDFTFTVGSAFGDVNGDGLVDLVLANQGNSVDPFRPVHVFFNQGGVLETQPSYASADAAISNYVGLADVDGSSLTAVIGHALVGDGATRLFHLPHLPVHAISRVEATTGVLPPYTVDRLSGRLHFASPLAAGQVVEIDYDHALYPDLGFSRWVNFETCIYANNGGAVASLPTWTTGDPTRADKGLGWSDLDTDGELDLAFGGTDETLLYRNDGGTLGGPGWSSINAYHGCQDLAWGDVDGDGDEDLATIHFGNGHVRVYLNRDGVLDQVPSWLYDLSSSATAIAWGDVNGDGRLDLAAGTARQPVVLFLNTGATTAATDLEPAAAAPGGRSFVASPNPFNPIVTLRLELGMGSAPAGPVVVVDALGRTVRRLAPTSSGPAVEVRWDGRDHAGRVLPSGTYFVRFQDARGAIYRGKLVLAR